MRKDYYIERLFKIMARVTVEHYLDKVENRFELVLVAAKRAHQLNSGG